MGYNSPMARLWAMTTSYESVQAGDYLPILLKWGTAATDAAALTACVIELLEKGFPPPCVQAEDSALTVETLAPVSAEDTISLSGTVVDKGTAGGLGLVKCAVVVENQDGVKVADATATVAFAIEQ